MNGWAFRGVNILKGKIEYLLREIDDSVMNYSECGEMLKLAYKQVESFEELAQTTLSTALDEAIDGEIRKLLHVVGEIDPKSETNEDVLQKLKEAMDSMMSPDELKMVGQKYSDGLYNLSSFVDDEDEGDRSAVSTEVIGVREVYQQLKNLVMSMSKFSPSRVTSLVGMPGIGKTTLAKKLFNDPTTVECFDHCVWVQVGKKYKAKDIPRLMIEEMHPGGLVGGDEEAVGEQLNASLTSKSYLIVLDDVWDRFTLHFFKENIRQLFQLSERGNQILITSRLQQLDESRTRINRDIIQMRLLNKEESWNLLRGRVFSQGLCPPQLEKAGKKISENCEGLPLTILAVARLLTQDEEKINPKYWDEIATKKNHQIYRDAYEEISKVLLPSYTYLPPLLQMCFMFIGLFPQKYEVPRSKLVNLWLADGFFELNVHISSKEVVFECLDELVSNSLVMVYQKSTKNDEYTIKSCGLHSSLWHMSKKKARETKFALILSSPNDGLGDGIAGHHRVSFVNNVLLGMKEVHKSVEDSCASVARSLFCFGPYHQYQVPLCFRLKFLKELDALSIRFYEFPMEVLQLVQLGYLSLTVSGMIPTSISQLQLLEFLIVDRHHNIKSCKDASYLPEEIWSLQKLKHLQIMGRDLPDPCGALLRNLSTLLDVSFHSCTTAILEGIPNLMNLKIRMELAPDDDGKPFTLFGTHHISNLSKIYSLKCVIVNPEVVPPVAPFLRFLKGTNLRNLSLSGLGYPWKEMRNIASLPNLVVLKLKNYAFQGPEWEVEEKKFTDLISLVIEDTDLGDWKIGSGAFSFIRSLTIKNCYKLQKLHGKFDSGLLRIKLVDCNPYFVEEIKKIASVCVTIDVHSSWEDEKRRT